MIKVLRSRRGARWVFVDWVVGFISFWLALNLTPHHAALYEAPFGLIAIGFGFCVALSSVFVGVPVVGRDHDAALYEIMVMSFLAACCAAMSFALISSLLFFTIFGRYILVLAVIFTLVLMILLRWIVFYLHRRTPFKIFLVGATAGQVSELSFLSSRSSAFKVVCVAGGGCFPGAGTIHLEKNDWLSELDSRAIDTVVLCSDSGLMEKDAGRVLEVPLHGITLFSYSSFLESLFKRVPIRYMSPEEVASIHVCSGGEAVFFFKRMLDVAVAVAGLLITWPLWGVIAMAIKLDSPGSFFFVQERDGIGESTFSLVKFRTMAGEARARGDDDHRITRVGRILRKIHLDELPQLLNVLKGDMSLVGPRPECTDYTDEFRKKIPHYAYRRLVRPGLTGWAQVRYRYSKNWQEAEQKFQYDLYYIRHLSFRLDICILLKTLPLLMKGSR